MITTREMLWECAMRGYFMLKADFVHRGWATPPEAPALPQDPFYQALTTYCRFCTITLQEHPSAMPKKRRLARYARWAIRVAVAVYPVYNAVEKKEAEVAEAPPCLQGGYLAIERSLLMLGIMGPVFEGFQLYKACCRQFHEWYWRTRPRPPAREVVAGASRVVATATGRSPCDLGNWVGPEDADWELIIQISRKLWALLGPEGDPFNALDREPGGPLPC